MKYKLTACKKQRKCDQLTTTYRYLYRCLLLASHKAINISSVDSKQSIKSTVRRSLIWRVAINGLRHRPKRIHGIFHNSKAWKSTDIIGVISIWYTIFYLHDTIYFTPFCTPPSQDSRNKKSYEMIMRSVLGTSKWIGCNPWRLGLIPLDASVIHTYIHKHTLFPEREGRPSKGLFSLWMHYRRNI